MDKEELEIKLIDALQDGDIPNSYKFVDENQVNHLGLIGVIKSLEATGCVVSQPVDEISVLTLTSEGEKFAREGSIEYRFYKSIDENGTPRTKLMEVFGKEAAGLGIAICMRNKWIEQDKTGLVKPNSKSSKPVTDETQDILGAIQQGTYDVVRNKTMVAALTKRNLVSEQKIKTYSITKGEQFTTERKQYLRDLDVETLRNSSWETAEWKAYNFATLGKPIRTGALHPLQKVRAEFRSFLVQMGFEEMPTNTFIESSFWNFDSLFQPQQHPARDAHDTFFLKTPAHANINTVADPEYFQRVKKIHEEGGFGSIGYRYDWSEEEAAKNILRTHTTASSSKMLYQVADEYKKTGVFTPRKYFSIDRVFRNETLDATHLAEFHQVEGLVVGHDLTLGHLIGVFKTFFSKIGIDDVKFKPAYNPYTEPSMEIFGYSKDLGKWIEVGNSGVFRPEMLRPMGIPEGVVAIAWGLSLERPTMIKYGLNNIRDLVGPRMQLKIIEKNPIARY